MSIDTIDFDQLLDPEQLESLLTSVVGIVPQEALFVSDTAGNLLARAGMIEIPAEIVDNLHCPVEEETATDDTTDTYVAIRAPLIVEDRQLGCVIGISFDSDEQVVQRLTATTRLVSQVLVDQIYKEYELNSLSTELLDKYEELTLLYDLTQDLGVIFDIQTICHIALERALEVVPAEKAYIALMDNNREYLTIIATWNIDGFGGWRIPFGEGISGRVATMGKQVLLNAREPAPSDSKKNLLLLDAVMSIPLVLPADQSQGGDQVLGVITLAGKPPGEMFTAGEAKLATTIMTQVTIAIHNCRLLQALKDAERVQQEMEIAAHIQRSLLPKHPPKLPGIALAGQCFAAANVGGDYYDFLTDEEGRLILLIADASGHSVGSALMIAMARSILRHEIALGRPLDEVLANTNTVMFDDLIEAEMFITMFCARYDPVTRELTFANGGHNHPLLRHATDGKIIALDNEGIILGIQDDATYEERSIVLDSGDILVLYTDGVVEARNPAGEQFGVKQLQKSLAKHHSLPPDELGDQIYKAIHQHTNNAGQQDDITLVILKVQEES